MRFAILSMLVGMCFLVGISSDMHAQITDRQKADASTTSDKTLQEDIVQRHFGKDSRISRVYGSLKLRGRALDCVAFSPDGSFLMTDGFRAIYRWNATSGDRVDQIPLSIISCEDIAYSPNGELFAYCGSDGLLAEHGQFGIFEHKSGREILTVKNAGVPDECLNITFSPNGAWLVTCGDRGLARVWDAKTGEILAELDFDASFVNGLAEVAYAPSGDSFVIVHGGLHIFDANANQRIFRIEPDDRRNYNAAVFLSETELLLGGLDREAEFATVLEVFDIEQERVVRQYDLAGRARGRVAVCVSPDGKRGLLETDDKYLCIDLKSGQVVWATDRDASVIDDPESRHLGFSPDGKHIAVAGAENVARIFDAATGARRLFDNAGHDRPMESFVTSPDGTRIASFGEDELVVWDTETTEQITRWKCAGDVSIEAGVWSPDNQQLYIIGTESRRLIALAFDVESHQLLFRTELPWVYRTSCAISDDGARLAVGGPPYSDENLRRLLAILDTNSGKVLHQLDRESGAPPVEHMRFRVNGEQLLTVADSEWCSWDLQKNALHRNQLPDSFKWTSMATASPRVAMRMSAHKVHILNTDSARIDAKIQIDDEFADTVTISPDGKRLCVTSCPFKLVNGVEEPVAREMRFRIWEIDSGMQIDAFVEPDEVYVEKVEFSPTGETLLVGCYSGVILAWELPATGDSQ